MNLELIKNEAESFLYKDSFFKDEHLTEPDEAVAFAKHCVEKSQQWIPLTESMPESMVQVLMWNGAHVFVEQWWGKGYLLDHRITHWKPLPQPPEAA